ncbi:MAG: glutamine synthetase [Clostridiales bacterium]|nr:glutamine synthetase [Clostridiales bacterium]
MTCSYEELMQYIEEEDVKFIRLAFCDVFGNRKNISVMPEELKHALEYGVAIDASLIPGFGDESFSDLFLHPDPSTTTLLPWRPDSGKVISLYCDITYQDGTVFENDTRSILKKAVKEASDEGLSFTFGSRMEFYLFKLDENGEKTIIPYDNAGYMDVAPMDKGENVRREICLTLERMGIIPRSSHHEAGPGQNQIDFQPSDPVSAADNACMFRNVVRTIAGRNGLWADFSPKPLVNLPGNGYHISIACSRDGKTDVLPNVIAGILDNIYDTTVFFNSTEKSYERFGGSKAPRYISWSSENRSSLIRIPPASAEHHYAQLRSPDPLANPYLAFAILIYAGLEGIRNDLELTTPANINFSHADRNILSGYKTLPLSLDEARQAAMNSEFVRKVISGNIIDFFCR